MPEPLLQPINWSYISAGVEFYSKREYAPVEVPWVVPPHVTRATTPSGVVSRSTQDGDLIGSGEQGLLFLAVEGKLSHGRWMTTTPCFRDDPVDELHGKHFVKVELIDIGRCPDVDQIIDDAFCFFSQFLSVKVIRIDPFQSDIVCTKTGIELGSYGVREALGIRWAYGTGVAEPRLSTVIHLSDAQE